MTERDGRGQAVTPVKAPVLPRCLHSAQCQRGLWRAPKTWACSPSRPSIEVDSPSSVIDPRTRTSGAGTRYAVEMRAPHSGVALNGASRGSSWRSQETSLGPPRAGLAHWSTRGARAPRPPRMGPWSRSARRSGRLCARPGCWGCGPGRSASARAGSRDPRPGPGGARRLYRIQKPRSPEGVVEGQVPALIVSPDGPASSASGCEPRRPGRSRNQASPI